MPEGVKTPPDVIVPPVAVQVTAVLYAPVPVTVATQVAVCAVAIDEGVATTETAVTVGCTTLTEMATTCVPNFVEFCVDVALIVSDPEAGVVEGAV